MIRLFAALLAGILLASPVSVSAQDEPVPAAAEAEAAPAAGYDSQRLSEEGFRPATYGGDEDTIPGGRLMLAAYLVFFVLLGWYVFQLTRRHSAVQRELVTLRKQMEDIDDRLDDFERETTK